MTYGYRRQHGMTFIGWIITLAVAGFFLLLALRLVPVYIEAYAVGSILNSMQSEGQLAGSSRGQLRDTFAKRLNINDVDAIDRKALEFEDVANGLLLTVDYEKRVPFVANLSLIARFHRQAVIPE